MSEGMLSRSSTRTTTYSVQGHEHGDGFHGTCPPSPTLSDSNQSMIFERNVEDPYMVSAATPSNPISKQGSTTSLLSRQYSNVSQQGTYHSGSGRPSFSHGMPHSPPSEGHSPEYVMPKLDRRRTLENFVAPALDASCSIVTDDNADLDDLDIVYMRRPSTLGLDMALGRTKSNSSATLTAPPNSGYTQAPPLELSRTHSNMNYNNNNNHNNNNNNNNISNNTTNTDSNLPNQDSRTLRFYSYADMLSDEMATSTQPMNSYRRPSLSHSSSFSYLRSNLSKPNLTTNFSNPFIKKRDSISSPTSASSSCLARHYSNTGISRSPTNQIPASYAQSKSRCCCNNKQDKDINKNEHKDEHVPPTSHKPSHQRAKNKSNFHIESSGSDEFSTDDEDDSHPLMTTSPNVTSPPAFLGPRVSRSSTQNSINSGSPLFSGRTYSNSGPNPISPSIVRRRESGTLFQQPSINNVLRYDDTLQTEKVGEALRKKISNRRDNAVK